MVRAKPDKCSRVAVRARRLLGDCMLDCLALLCCWAVAGMRLSVLFFSVTDARIETGASARVTIGIEGSEFTLRLTHAAHALPARRTAQRPAVRAHAPTQPDSEPGWS